MRIQTVFAVLLAAPAVLAAQGSSSQGVDMSVGVRVGTLGIGIEANKLLTSHVGARVGFNAFSKNTTRAEDEHFIRRESEAGIHSPRWSTLYPSERGSFHLTAGISPIPSSSTGVGVPTGRAMKSNGTTYNRCASRHAQCERRISVVLPYVGFGFGTPPTAARREVCVRRGRGIGQPTPSKATNP